MTVSDPIVQEGLWDLTKGSIPLFTDGGVELYNSNSYGVEFNRDVMPIINNSCVSCHTPSGTGSMLVLDDTNPMRDAYAALTTDDNNQYNLPQVSKYLRVPQARQSLFAWVAWGERLDGRLNSDRDDDVDYPDSHPNLSLTDLEKRTIARWIDLGAPIDFPELNMEGQEGFRYTDDYQLPVINIHQPRKGNNNSKQAIIGFADAKSGLDWSSLTITYYSADGSLSETVISSYEISERNVVTFTLPTLTPSKNYILKAEIMDLAGNKNIHTTNFSYIR
jgi:hypothetical protein